MINWIKTHWEKPVWSNVFASLIVIVLSAICSFIWSIVQSIFTTDSFKESVDEVLSKLNESLAIPLWLFFFLSGYLVVSIVLSVLRKTNNVDPMDKTVQQVKKADEALKIIHSWRRKTKENELEKLCR